MLAEDLSKILRVMRYPHVSQRHAKILLDKGYDLVNVLASGIHYLELNYFPRMRSYDSNRNVIIKWKGMECVEILHGNGEKSLELKSAEMTMEVLSYLVNRKVCYEKTVLPLQSTTRLPWMVNVLHKVKGLYKSDVELLRICLYVTCVAMIQNRMYVDFRKFAEINHDLGPRVVFKLIQVEVLGKIPLSNMNLFKVYRLHESLPFKMPKVNIENAAAVTTPGLEGESSDSQRKLHHINDTEELRQDQDTYKELENEQDELDRYAREMCGSVQEVVHVKSRQMPMNRSRQPWNSIELSIVSSVLEQSQPTTRHYYDRYVKESLQLNLSYRTLKAFQKKLYRLKETD